MKTKSNIMIVIAVIAVGLVSFISGRMSASGAKVEPTVGAAPVQANAPQVSANPASAAGPKVEPDVTGGSTGTSTGNYLYVASKSGTRYFPVGCGSAKTIKPDNAVYFQTAAEAEATGKTQSPQCKY